MYFRRNTDPLQLVTRVRFINIYSNKMPKFPLSFDCWISFLNVAVITWDCMEMCWQIEAWLKNRPCHTGYGNPDAQVIVIDCLHMARIIINLSLSLFSLLCHDPLFLFSSVSGLGPRQAAAWEAPHGLQAHLVCLLSFLPIVKLNVLL